MRNYRKSKKDYPDGVLGIYDNNGKSIDRYTIVYKPWESIYYLVFPYLAMNENPLNPQGFAQHGELNFRYTRQNGEKCINFSELPIDCQKVIESDLQENATS